MGKKKTKTPQSENLIESLMEDLKDLDLESSYDESVSHEFSDDVDESLDLLQGSPLWENLEKNIGSSVNSDSSESEFLSTQEEVYKGPSADMGYQSLDDILGVNPAPKASVQPKTKLVVDDATRPTAPVGGEDKTVSIQQEMSTQSVADGDKTIAVEGFAQAKSAKKRTAVDVQVSVGDFRGVGKSVLTSVDASLAQAENLKIAQRRILDLEKEVESLRTENEELASAGEIIRIRTDELEAKVLFLEREKQEDKESAHSEILMLKGSLQHRDTELAKSKIKIEELEARLKSDFKKIRVPERELENRLELVRAEKAALTRSKDEYILEQKRKIDQLTQELDNYRKKCLELNKALEANQDQFKRTERALRLALTNLEVNDDGVVSLKKAE